VDLTCGVIAANLPALSSLIPRSWTFLQGSRATKQQPKDSRETSSTSETRVSTNKREQAQHLYKEDSQERILHTEDIELQHGDRHGTPYTKQFIGHAN
jgi:hypothetical protein